MSVTKDLQRMFKRLQISDSHEFGEFLLGELDDQPWFLKVPVRETMKKVQGQYVRVRHRPRASYKGQKDYLHRQLYRHFVSDDIKGKSLLPRDNRDNYNPKNWRLGVEAVKAPVSIKTTPTFIDPEVLELVEELERRALSGEDVWAGVAEMFTELEIAQAKEVIDEKIRKSQD